MKMIRAVIRSIVRPTFVGLLAVASVSAIQGCGDKKKKTSNDVTVKFKNIDTAAAMLTQQAQNPARNPAGNLSGMAPNRLDPAYVTQRSFTPVSLKFPVKRIVASGSNMDSATVYECPGSTAAECYVDFADKEAVAALVSKPVTVTYEEGKSPVINQFDVVVDPACGQANGERLYFDVLVKGTFQINGTTYYTTSTDPSGQVITSNASYYSAAAVTSSTCTMRWNLATPAPANTSGTIVSLFISIKDIVYGNSAVGDNQPFCKSGTGNGSSLCMFGYAVPYPYVGDGDPVIESFKITETTAGEYSGALGMVHTAKLNGVPVGAFQRGYFDGTSGYSTHCSAGSWLDAIKDNGDGSYKMTIALGDGRDPYELFSAFKFENHSGTCGTMDGGSYTYTATKL